MKRRTITKLTSRGQYAGDVPGTARDSESKAIVDFLLEMGKGSAWRQSQKQYGCREERR